MINSHTELGPPVLEPTLDIPIQSINFPSQTITSGSNLQDDLVGGGLAIEQNHYSCS